MLLLFGGIEEPNLIGKSELLEAPIHGLSNLVLGVNNIASPDGRVTAELCIPQTASAAIRTTNVAVDQNSIYTFSVFLKSTGANRVLNISIRDSGQSPISGLNIAITVTGDWKRFNITGDIGANSNVRPFIGGSSTWGVGEDLYAWGKQLNKGIISRYQRTGPIVTGFNVTAGDNLGNLADGSAQVLS